MEIKLTIHYRYSEPTMLVHRTFRDASDHAQRIMAEFIEDGARRFAFVDGDSIVYKVRRNRRTLITVRLMPLPRFPQLELAAPLTVDPPLSPVDYDRWGW